MTWRLQRRRKSRCIKSDNFNRESLTLPLNNVHVGLGNKNNLSAPFFPVHFVRSDTEMIVLRIKDGSQPITDIVTLNKVD